MQNFKILPGKGSFSFRLRSSKHPHPLTAGKRTPLLCSRGMRMLPGVKHSTVYSNWQHFSVVVMNNIIKSVYLSACNIPQYLDASQNKLRKNINIVKKWETNVGPVNLSSFHKIDRVSVPCIIQFTATCLAFIEFHARPRHKPGSDQ